MKTWLVTGAARGIGLELCAQLKGRGESVIATCRERSSELLAIGAEAIDGVDVSNEAAIAVLAKKLAGRKIDVLVNNAGILGSDSLGTLDRTGLLKQFEVNALGPLLVTQALLGNLGKGSKVAIITSRMGSIADNSSGGMYGYRMSKAAVNMAGASLAQDLKSRGIAVTILHPGMVATRMTGGAGIPVNESARGIIARIDETTLDNTGSFHHQNGQPLPW
jgi:NAD(P)-dependent dehydrogenase (short-subunit alcohol dehydrogenase family)